MKKILIVVVVCFIASVVFLACDKKQASATMPADESQKLHLAMQSVAMEKQMTAGESEIPVSWVKLKTKLEKQYEHFMDLQDKRAKFKKKHGYDSEEIKAKYQAAYAELDAMLSADVVGLGEIIKKAHKEVRSHI